jgi:hypothetical protein
MNATQPTGGPSAHLSPDSTVQELVDALASGRCDGATFLASMRDPMGPDATGNWEVLSLLDQYYRRGKISKELYQEVRIGLAQVALGLHREEAPRVPARAAPSTPTPTPSPPPPQAQPQPQVPMPESNTVTAPAVAREVRAETRRTSAAEAAREINVGDVLRNRYRIVGVLGKGGMGTVYEADDNYRLDIPPNGQGLAIKVLHTSVTKRAELFSELRREFQHLQSLSHPNIVRAFEFDRDGPLAFFTMELLNGALLSQVLLSRNRQRLDTADAWAIVRDVGNAIAHAHSRNVVHGDINPQNIFITQRGNVRVLDFGASHAVAKSGTAGEVYSASFATPGYVSCQVLEGARPDARDDVFALACVAYLLLSGEHPFKSHTAIEARSRSIKPKRLAELSGRQWRALRAGLNWDREKRPADVAAWMRALDLRGAAEHLPPLGELAARPAPARRRVGWALALTAVALCVVAVGYWVATHYDEVSERVAAIVDSNSSKRVAKPLAVESEPAAASQEPSPTLSSVSPASRAAPAATATAPASAPAPVPAAPVNKPIAVAAAPTAAALAASSTAAAAPKAAPARIGSQIELAADTVDVPPHDPSASVLVHRKGNLHSRVGFTWWTESGTAKPATDFSPVAPHLEYFDEGKSTVTLSIRVADTEHEQDKSFYVVIDAPEEGSTLGARALTMVTLPGSQSSK